MSRVIASRAAVWSAIDLMGRQATTFVVSVVLARLLTPADFGAVAIMTFFVMLGVMCLQQGLATAVIQRHEADDAEVSSIFWWGLFLSATFSFALVLAGPAVARFYGLSILSPLMIAAAAQVTFSSLGSIHAALLSRKLRYDSVARAGIPSTLLSGIIGIGLALSGAGVWALAAQLVSAAALNSAALWVVCSWRPQWVLRSDGFFPAAKFAGWLSLSGGLEVLYSQSFALFIGKFYGPRDLGLYTRAATTQQLPANVISAVINRVAVPLFAARKSDPDALARGLLTANRLTMIVAMPLLVGLGLTCDLVIFVLFGQQWAQAAPVLGILAWAGLLFPLHANNLQLLMAAGRSDLYFRVELVKKTLGVIILAIGSFFGVIGLAWSQVAVSVLALVINTGPSGELFGCGLRRQLADLLGIVFATAAMGIAVIWLRQSVNLTPVPELLIVAFGGVATYLLVGLGLGIDAFRDALVTARSLRHSTESL